MCRWLSARHRWWWTPHRFIGPPFNLSRVLESLAFMRGKSNVAKRLGSTFPTWQCFVLYASTNGYRVELAQLILCNRYKNAHGNSLRNKGIRITPTYSIFPFKFEYFNLRTLVHTEYSNSYKPTNLEFHSLLESLSYKNKIENNFIHFFIFFEWEH